MRRAALACLTGLALALPAQAQTAGPLRGNLRARTALSWSYNRQYEQKIFPTLESGLFRIEDSRLDWLGLADEGYRFTNDSWLAYRGAAAAFTEARPELTVVPGFEWLLPPRPLTIYGSDHFCPGRAQEPQWPVFRIGRMMADITADERGLRLLSPQWLRRGIELSRREHFYEEAMAADLFSVPNYHAPPQWDLTNQKALEKPQFMGSEPASNDPYQNASAPGLLYPPIESIWGPPSSGLANELNLSRGHILGTELQSHGLKRMEKIAGTLPGGATSLMDTLQDELRRGEAPATYMERLMLPPGWWSARLPEFTRDNPQYAQACGEYYALLEKGISLFQTYGGGGLSKQGLESARWSWAQGTLNQHMIDMHPNTIRSWDRMIEWLELYDPQQAIVAQLNTPDNGGPQGWLPALDPRKLRNRPKARERFALMDMAYELQTVGDLNPSATPLGQGPYPTGQPPPTNGPYPGGSPLAGSAPAASNPGLRVPTLVHYYNLALRNGWRLAPVTSLDNLGPLDAHANRLLPAARSTFTGLYAGSEQNIVSGTSVNLGRGVDRIQALMQALHARRTFVSENGFVDGLLYARDVSTGRLAVMGDSLFQRGGMDPVTFEFTLQLTLNARNQTTQGRRIKVEDIRVVEIVERERDLDVLGRRLRIAEATRNPSVNISAEQFSLLVSDEIPVCKYYSSGAVAQPGTSAGVGTILANYGLTGTPLNPPEPDTYPLPVTFTWRSTVRPHRPGGTLAYYVKARLPAMGSFPECSIVTAPLWTVTDWSRFSSIDEAQ